MTKEELKNKCTERAKIFQQAMKNCKSSNPMELIEWFADRIVDLEKENAELDCQKNRNKACYSCANATERCFRNEIGCPCEKYKSYKDENAELKEKLSEQKQYTEFKCNEAVKKKELYEKEHFLLTKAKEHIRTLISCLIDWVQEGDKDYCHIADAEQFLKENE